MAQGSLRIAQEAKKAKEQGDLYSISYDLINAKPKDYKKLERALMKLQAEKVLLSHWIVRSPLAITAIRNVLSLAISVPEFRLVVIRIADYSTLNPITKLDSL